MSSTKRVISQIAQAVLKALSSGKTSRPSSDGGSGRPAAPRAKLREHPRSGGPDAGVPIEHGREQGSETIRLDPDSLPELRVEYAPERDGAPDAGEVIWTWVPYEENDGRGKDRPVLVIGVQSASRVFAVRMTSKAHEHDRDYLSIGSGAWDSQGRESWVDIEQLYSVHVDGMRREAAILDRGQYDRVAQALSARYGWARRG